MEPKVLGRITTAMERPRGPDVQMVVAVPEDWIASGATLEIQLPRNLACAACGGGGCDACERSGAVSLRGRKEPIETVEVTLPSPRTVDEFPARTARVVVVRIPDRGGLAPSGHELPRGNLLLSVRSGTEPGRGVSRLAQPSMPPPPPVEIVSLSAEDLAPAPGPSRRRTAIALGAAALLVVLALLWWLKR
jgi:hypothetical protein